MHRQDSGYNGLAADPPVRLWLSESSEGNRGCCRYWWDAKWQNTHWL